MWVKGVCKVDTRVNKVVLQLDLENMVEGHSKTTMFGCDSTTMQGRCDEYRLHDIVPCEGKAISKI